ncbi:uncharacterized protein LOC126835938 [Adelges cooleyi]|uniref:uncharacterized protein LOC126835938 n=1 Tax=Adelges cooleyi TaxID=133065 RepID=UPI0021809188|nr:uncharacterized protein LOC126835938 [Adelges cooleyi]
MNSNMRFCCVVLFAIFSFGLIISLHAASSSDTPPAKRIKSSEEEVAENEVVGDNEPLNEEAASEASADNDDPIENIKRELQRDPYLMRCFQRDEVTNKYIREELHPFYFDVVEEAQEFIKNGNEAEARKNVTTATKAMVLGLKDDANVIVDEESVDNLWGNYDLRPDTEASILKKIKDAVDNFVNDVNKKNK